MLGLFLLITIFSLGTFLYMRQEKFGSLPKGARLEKIKKSPNYRNGKFRNILERPTLSKGHNMLSELYKLWFKRKPNRIPSKTIPSIKTNLKAFTSDENVLVWFGHSSLFLHLNGVKIAVDPVFSGNASPIPNSIKAFDGSDIYSVQDLPDLEYLLLSHDHYDHLDYETVKELQPKVKKVICGLGVGAHLEKWGYKQQQIIEKDWGDKVLIKPDFTIYIEQSHHGSGRGFKLAQSLWVSFLIKTPKVSVYYSGDGGYTNRFQNIYEKHGPVDWAIMDCGQYNKAWQSIHALPEEVAKATLELKATNLLPVHHSKFTLSRHPWDEPLEKISELSYAKPYKLATPMIGEKVTLDDRTQVFQQWWK